eukprot:Rmarinus@m.20779
MPTSPSFSPLVGSGFSLLESQSDAAAKGSLEPNDGTEVLISSFAASNRPGSRPGSRSNKGGRLSDSSRPSTPLFDTLPRAVAHGDPKQGDSESGDGFFSSQQSVINKSATIEKTTSQPANGPSSSEVDVTRHAPPSLPESQFRKLAHHRSASGHSVSSAAGVAVEESLSPQPAPPTHTALKDHEQSGASDAAASHHGSTDKLTEGFSFVAKDVGSPLLSGSQPYSPKEILSRQLPPRHPSPHGQRVAKPQEPSSPHDSTPADSSSPSFDFLRYATERRKSTVEAVSAFASMVAAPSAAPAAASPDAPPWMPRVDEVAAAPTTTAAPKGCDSDRQHSEGVGPQTQTNARHGEGPESVEGTRATGAGGSVGGDGAGVDNAGGDGSGNYGVSDSVGGDGARGAYDDPDAVRSAEVAHRPFEHDLPHRERSPHGGASSVSGSLERTLSTPLFHGSSNIDLVLGTSAKEMLPSGAGCGQCATALVVLEKIHKHCISALGASRRPLTTSTLATADDEHDKRSIDPVPDPITVLHTFRDFVRERNPKQDTRIHQIAEKAQLRVAELEKRNSAISNNLKLMLTRLHSKEQAERRLRADLRKNTSMIQHLESRLAALCLEKVNSPPDERPGTAESDLMDLTDPYASVPQNANYSKHMIIQKDRKHRQEIEEMKKLLSSTELDSKRSANAAKEALRRAFRSMEERNKAILDVVTLQTRATELESQNSQSEAAARMHEDGRVLAENRLAAAQQEFSEALQRQGNLTEQANLRAKALKKTLTLREADVARLSGEIVEVQRAHRRALLELQRLRRPVKGSGSAGPSPSLSAADDMPPALTVEPAWGPEAHVPSSPNGKRLAPIHSPGRAKTTSPPRYPRRKSKKSDGVGRLDLDAELADAVRKARADAQNTRQLYEHRLAKTKREAESMERQLTERVSQLEFESQRDRQTHFAIVEDLEKRLQEAVTSVSAHQTELDATKKRVAELAENERQIVELQTELAFARSKMQHLQGEVENTDGADATIRELKLQVDLMTVDRNDMASQLEANETVVKELQQTVEEKTETIESQTGQIAELQKSIDEKCAMLNKLRVEKREVETKLENMHKIRDNLRAMLEDSNQKLQELEADHHLLEEENERVESALARKDEEFEALESEKHKLKHTMMSLQDQMLHLETRLTESKKNELELSQKVVKLVGTGKKAAAEEESGDGSSVLQSIQDSLQRAREEAHVFEEKLKVKESELQVSHAQLAKKNQALVDTMQKLETTKEELNNLKEATGTATEPTEEPRRRRTGAGLGRWKKGNMDEQRRYLYVSEILILLLEQYRQLRYVDGNDMPSDSELEEYAEFLQLDLRKFPHLKWIALEAIDCPLPPHWTSYTDEDNNMFFVNEVSRDSQFAHPLDAYFTQLANLLTRRCSPDDVVEQFLSHADSKSGIHGGEFTVEVIPMPVPSPTASPRRSTTLGISPRKRPTSSNASARRGSLLSSAEKLTAAQLQEILSGEVKATPSPLASSLQNEVQTSPLLSHTVTPSEDADGPSDGHSIGGGDYNDVGSVDYGEEDSPVIGAGPMRTPVPRRSARRHFSPPPPSSKDISPLSNEAGMPEEEDRM